MEYCFLLCCNVTMAEECAVESNKDTIFSHPSRRVVGKIRAILGLHLLCWLYIISSAASHFAPPSSFCMKCALTFRLVVQGLLSLIILSTNHFITVWGQFHQRRLESVLTFIHTLSLLKCCYVCAANCLMTPSGFEKNPTPYNVAFLSNGYRVSECRTLFSFTALPTLSDFSWWWQTTPNPPPCSQTELTVVWNRISSMWHANAASCLWYMRALIDSMSQCASLIPLMFAPCVEEGFLEMQDTIQKTSGQQHIFIEQNIYFPYMLQEQICS